MDHPLAEREAAPITTYQLFLAALSVLSIVNLVLVLFARNNSVLIVIGVLNLLLSLFFFIDFMQRFVKAPSKSTYFFRGLGWADLLASLPFPQVKIFRMFRILKVYGIIKKVGLRNVVDEFFNDRANSALYLILFLIIVVLEFGSIAILAVEGNDPAANIHTASDAIWWVYVTITTVGYGDKYPVTNEGRAIGMCVMLVGVGLFGVLTGFLANKFLPPSNATIDPTPRLKKLEHELEEIKQLLKNRP